MAGERKGSFFEGTPGNRSSGDGVGPVAQRIRARGYEPRLYSTFKRRLSIFEYEYVLPECCQIDNLINKNILDDILFYLYNKL
ncbi:hypothetical protein CASFOL_007861 [Castilleja foliolosa]|uniref:Uncharacterized protein n=1 Tax=Castilleja foliolosa TaxID=1961234 RepID=A0ABD3E343_9LAMI